MNTLLLLTVIISTMQNTLSVKNIVHANTSVQKKQTVSAELISTVSEASNFVPGKISIKYETSNAGGDFISKGIGDAGGKSYGVSQFTSKSDASANDFVKWLMKEDSNFETFFKDAGIAGTDVFDKAWIDAFNFNPTLFTNYQKEYTMNFYVKPFIKNCKEELGVDFSSTMALQEAAYSLAVQFGATGGLTVCKNSGMTKNSTEEEIIKLLYAEKLRSIGTYKFLKCDKDTQEGVRSRFIREEKDILEIFNSPSNPLINLNFQEH